MNPAQQAFLQQIASKIPRLFAAIAAGNVRAEFILGQRVIKGRQVRLKLVAEVVDPGANPLATHGCTMGLAADQSSALPSDAELLRLSCVGYVGAVLPPGFQTQGGESIGMVSVTVVPVDAKPAPL